MKVKVIAFGDTFFSVCSSVSSPRRHRSPSDPILLSLPRLVSKSRGVEIKSVSRGGGGGGGGGYLSAWDDKPHELLPGGKRAYFDEQDVVTFLDSPIELIPLDPSSYNPSAYLWKKIGDIPDERRHRLLNLLQPRLISRAWEIAGTRFEDAILAKKTASHMLSGETGLTSSVECYNCRTSGGPPSISWMKFFKKAIFCDSDQKIYGRFLGELMFYLGPITISKEYTSFDAIRLYMELSGDSMVAHIGSSSKPLYFAVRQVKEVMSTEQPCDLAYEFGDGHWNLNERPEGFPKPERHPHPFDDEVIVYVRYIGPGILIGQAWQEGKELQQLPQKLCGEILMVKDYVKS